MNHRRQVRIVEVERVRRRAENDGAVFQRFGDLTRRRLAQPGEDAARDIEERALRLAANRRRQVFPARARQEAGQLLRYSALMPAVFTTGAHFAISSRMNVAKASGEPRIGSAPCAWRRPTTSLDSSICPTARFSRST